MLPLILMAFAAAPPAAAPAPSLAGFALTEQAGEILRLFREEPHTTTTPSGRILQFHGKSHSQGCDESRQWVFYFGRRENRLVSVTRNLEHPEALESLIPRAAKPKLYKTASGYPVLRAALPDGREFVAAGARTLKDRVSQVQLLRTSDVPRFYPDLRPDE
jgi:hypothetical protein